MVGMRADTRNILIVEGETDITETVSGMLESAGFTSAIIVDISTAADGVSATNPDLVVVNVSNEAGIELLRQLRANSTMPLIAVNEGLPRSSVAALEAGADDVISTPIAREELVARVLALFRRIDRTPPPDDRIIMRNLELYLTRRIVTLRGRRLHLTPIEYSILATLMRNADRTVTHDELLRSVWGASYEGDYSVLRVNISRLRQKLEDNPRNPGYIMTVPGEGYIMHTNGRRTT